MTRKTILFLLLFLVLTLAPASSRQLEASVPSFGQGPVEVRFYTDYFCPPCQATEPAIEPILMDLLSRKAIRLTIIDTPFNRGTPLLARYYLFASRDIKEVKEIFRVRKVILEAAKRFVSTPEEVEALLRENKVPFKAFDVKPVFEGYNALIKEDKINATPTAVIIEKGTKRVLLGGNEILRALKALP